MSSKLLWGLASAFVDPMDGSAIKESVYAQFENLVNRHLVIQSTNVPETPVLINNLCPDNYVTLPLTDGNMFLYICRSPRRRVGGAAEEETPIVFDGMVSRLGPADLLSRPRRVFFKFAHRASRTIVIDRQIAAAAALARTPPIFPIVYGRIGATAFQALASAGVELGDAKFPGAIFEYVEGRPLSSEMEQIGGELQELELPKKEVLGTEQEQLTPGEETRSLLSSVVSDWTACITAQRMLLHVFSFSRGLFVKKMTPGRLLLNDKQKFILSENVRECGVVRVADIAEFEKITDASLPGQLAQALHSLEDLYVWANARQSDKLSPVFVDKELVKMIAEVVLTDCVLEDALMEFLRNCADRAIQNNEDKALWIIKLYQDLDLELKEACEACGCMGW